MLKKTLLVLIISTTTLNSALGVSARRSAIRSQVEQNLGVPQTRTYERNNPQIKQKQDIYRNINVTNPPKETPQTQGYRSVKRQTNNLSPLQKRQIPDVSREDIRSEIGATGNLGVTDRQALYEAKQAQLRPTGKPRELPAAESQDSPVNLQRYGNKFGEKFAGEADRTGASEGASGRSRAKPYMPMTPSDPSSQAQKSVNPKFDSAMRRIDQGYEYSRPNQFRTSNFQKSSLGSSSESTSGSSESASPSSSGASSAPGSTSSSP